MQLRHALTALLFALCCAEGVAGREAVLRRRQENTDVATAPASSESAPQDSATSTPAPPSSTAEASPTSEISEEPASTTADQSPTVSPSVTSSTIGDTSTRTEGAAQATETAKKEEQLPIQPVITPAIGIAGVILIGTGVAFCLIGIKHQWLHVYLSAAYSTSLAVTVLVVYVMTPPISDAIQGAYLVAAVITGLIFGALSLVFKEITEGLGCLIGGFCLAMWLMVLRPGGLIQTDPGRAIMIGVFSAVGLSLSFSQYTRNYGLIGCTSFAGAMSTVIGIDCFSRAGLKEFWLYIWNLNNDIFPIGTNTYPITRGIRVEIAVTIIIFLFGLMSQLKIWKIVKERREKKEARRVAEDESRDQLAGEVGQDVEALNERQRAQWEVMYGDTSKTRLNNDSGVGTSVASTHKKSASVTTRELDTIEMDDVQGRVKQSGSKAPAPSTIREQNGTDEDLATADNNDWETDLARSADWSSHAGSRSQRSASSVNEAAAYEPVPVQQPGGPEVVPLPFSPSTEEDVTVKSDAGSTKSRGTAVTELNPLALKQHNERMSPRLPRIEDDRASSIAATADDEPDVDGDSIKRRSIMRPAFRVKSPIDPEANQHASPRDGLFPDDEQVRDRSRTPSGQRTPQEPALDDEDDEALVRPQTALDESEAAPRVKSRMDSSKRDSSINSRRRSVGSRRSAEIDRADLSGDDQSAVGSLTGHLPAAISKVAMAYRTNEWAKHIADADQPDELPQEPDSPGIQVDTAFREEAARPVDTAALSEVAVVSPIEGPRKPSKRASKNPSRQSKDPSQLQRSSSATPVYAFQRSSSQQSLMRRSSSRDQLKRDTRAIPTPLGQPLLESPVEEGPPDHFVTPMTSSSNLLDQRNDRLKRKTTTTNFNALASLLPEDGHVANPSSPVESNAAQTQTQAQAQGEEMTLAQRKALMLSQHQPSTSPPPQLPRRTSSGVSPNQPPPVTRMHSTANPALIYDSHQPRRSSTVDAAKQNAIYSQWRTSLQQSHSQSHKTSPYGVAVEEQARQQMLHQRETAARERQKRQDKRMQRESMMDVAMRTGQLHSAHNGVLKKMQAEANKSVREQ